MKYFGLISFFFAAILISSCDQGGFTVKGSVEDAPNLSVYFDKVNPISNTNSVVAKGETSNTGSFSLALDTPPSKGTYRIRIGAKSVYLMLDGSEKRINLNGTLKDFSNFSYSVQGSDLSQEYASKVKQSIDGSLQPKDLLEYLSNEADPMVGMMIAAQRFSAVTYAPVHQALSQKMKTAYPDQDVTQEYINYASGLQREYTRQQSLSIVKVGEMAPDISLPDLNGEERKLSDLKGQVVLLDFWASWCGPCRRENPNVVRVYDKYNPEGFTVYSVSLDGIASRMRGRYNESQLDNKLRSEKLKWVNAIKKDNLKWDNHVSDLKKWESQAAATYGVTSIPRTFLVDREGKIAAINPRRNLESAVNDLIKA